VLVHEFEALEGGEENAGELRGCGLLMLTRLHEPIVEGESAVGHAQGRDGVLEHGVHGVALFRAGFWLRVHHVGRFDVAVVGRVDKILLGGVDRLDELGHLPLRLHLVFIIEDFGDRFGGGGFGIGCWAGLCFLRAGERRGVDAPEGAVAYEGACSLIDAHLQIWKI